MLGPLCGDAAESRWYDKKGTRRAQVQRGRPAAAAEASATNGPFSVLPDELVLKILQRVVDVESVAVLPWLMLVCRRWSKIARSDGLCRFVRFSFAVPLPHLGAVSPSNDVASWSAGTKVVVHGLVKAAELNYQTATIVRWMADKGRYRVNLDGQAKSIKPANLKLAANVPVRACELAKDLPHPTVTARVFSRGQRAAYLNAVEFLGFGHTPLVPIVVSSSAGKQTHRECGLAQMDAACLLLLLTSLDLPKLRCVTLRDFYLKSKLDRPGEGKYGAVPASSFASFRRFLASRAPQLHALRLINTCIAGYDLLDMPARCKS